MLERIAGKVLGRFLSKYFEDEQEGGSSNGGGGTTRKRSQRTSFSSGVWSGFLSLDDLRLRVDVINAELQAAGLPIEMVHCSIRKVEMTVPWSQWKILSSSGSGSSPGSDSAVLVLDGVHVLARMRYDFHDESLMRERAIAKRRKKLKEAAEDLTATSTASGSNPTTTAQASWKAILKQRLQEGVLPALLDRLQLHIRDLHVRLEDCHARKNQDYDPFAMGIVLQSIHIQHDLEASGELDKSRSRSSKTKSPSHSLIHKVAQLNRFGLYCSPLEQEGGSILPESRIEQKMLHNLAPAEIIEALDQTIPRRSVDRASVQTQANVPQHIYLLLPLDGRLYAAISTNPKFLSDQPAIQAICTVTDVSFQIRDFQCFQLMRLHHNVKEYKYSLRHRHFRPLSSVHDNPRAWWFYAVTAIRHELTEKHHRLRWSFGRFQRQYHDRKRFCDLYERKLRETSPDDAAGPRRGPIITVPGASAPLSTAEKAELEAMEDGVLGDLSVQDILLYRIIVHKRIGLKPSAEETISGRRINWFQRRLQSMVGEDVEEDEYLRLLDYWQNWSTAIEEGNRGEGSVESVFSVAVAIELQVEKGHLSLFSPLASTSDQTQLRRLQERFLDFTYTGFEVEFALLGDYESLAVDVVLRDFTAAETRSNQKKYAVIAREGERMAQGGSEKNARCDINAIESLCVIRFTKNSPEYQDFRYGVQCRLRKLAVDLVPDSEWIGRFKQLIQPIPQFQKASNFWRDLNMANINSWASNRLGLLAKAETAVTDHSAFDLDIEVECPFFRVEVGRDSILSLDLGRAVLKTGKLAGVANSHLLRTVGRSALLRKTSSVVGDNDDSVDNGLRDDSSWRTPQVKQKSGSNVPHSAGLHTGTGDYLGVSLRLDDSFADVDPLRDNFISIDRPGNDQSNANRVEAYFYDTYELLFQTGDIFIETVENSTERVASAIELRAALHKSTIPADHTMCRYKAVCVVDSLTVQLSKMQILLLGAATVRWASVLSHSSATHVSRRDFPRHAELDLIGPLSPEIPPPKLHDMRGDDSRDESDFEEAEFFDAAEEESYLSDHVSVLLDDDWVADSESVLESEARSRSPSVRRRPRQSSIVSEVSSLSEGSISRRRLQFQDGEEHLTAENLARLEEEESEDASESQAGSFHSAVSLSHLVTLAQQLERDISEANARIVDLKSTIRDLRQVVGQDDSLSGNSQRTRSKKQLRVDLERSTVELKALKAARVDVLTQIHSAEGSSGVENFSGLDRAQVSNSVRGASALIQSIKKRSRREGTSGPEHSMTHGLMRELFQCSLVVNFVEVQLRELDQPGVESAHFTNVAHDLFSFRVSDMAAMIRHRIRETKLYATVDTVAFNFLSSEDPLKENAECVLVGGIQDSVSRHQFTSRFPEFAFSSGIEEKFLKVTVDLRHGAAAGTDERNDFRVARLRLNFGEIEFSPRASALWKLYSTLVSIRCDLASQFVSLQKERLTDRKLDNTAKRSLYYDVVFRCAAGRVVLGEVGDFGCALLLSDFGARAVGSSVNRLYKDRLRVDLRCSNAQAVYLLGPQKAVEVFGKRDAYGPSLLRLRMKLQSVPIDCTGGWVLDQPDPSDCDEVLVATFGAKQESPHDGCAWNCHAGVKVESTHSLVLPCVVSGVHKSISVLAIKRNQSPWSETGLADISNPKETLARRISNRPFRWRVDLSVRDLSIGFRMLKAIRDELVGDEFELVMSLVATAQLSARLRRGILLNASARNLSLSSTTEQWTLLKPSTVEIFAEAGTNNPHGSDALREPQFVLPEDFVWKNWTRDPQHSAHFGFSNEQNGRQSDVMSVVVPPLEIDLSAPVCVSVTNILQAFRAALPVSRSNAGRIDGKEEVPKGSLGQSKRLDIVLNGLSLNLYRAKGSEPSVLVSGPKASFLIQNVEVHCQQTGLSSSLLVKMADCSLIDFACRHGIRGVCVESGESRGDGNAALEGSCQMTNTTGRPEATFDLNVGRVQILPLPSLVRSLLTFVKDVKAMRVAAVTSSAKALDNKERSRSLLSTKLVNLKSFSFSVRVVSLECILSSKDLPKYVRENQSEAIGVVTFRLRLDVSGCCDVLQLDDEMTFLPGMLIDCENSDNDSLQRAFAEYILPKLSTGKVRPALLSKLDCTVKRFQVLRTAIVRIEQIPFSFFVFPPNEGEQRITNSFGFAIAQQGALVFPSTKHPSDEKAGMRFSQSIRVQADFVDVLVYISQSDSGMSEALRVTILPIVDSFKKTGDNKQESRASRGKGLKENVLESSSIVSVRADGVKFTFVPGGATRLTESPIIKFEVLRLALGFAAVPVKSDVKLLSETSLDTMTSRLTQYHLVTGAWLRCELSASYHNRRLVAWEPFIEPWTFEARLGADLVRLCLLQPVSTRVGLEETTQYCPDTSLSTPLGSRRLRDIGRLLSSPFVTTSNPDQDAFEESGEWETEVDFCYLILLCSAQKLISSALFSSSSLSAGKSLLSYLPGSSPLQWLYEFGMPMRKQSDSKDVSKTPSFVCWMSDAVPLNINLTGALIENLSEYAKSFKEEKTSRLVPHWIRNDSGLVGVNSVRTTCVRVSATHI